MSLFEGCRGASPLPELMVMHPNPLKKLLAVLRLCATAFSVAALLAGCSPAGADLPPLPEADQLNRSYVLGAGDRIIVHIYGDSGTAIGGGAGDAGQAPPAPGNDGYTISDTGKIGVPLLGEVQAAGRTIGELTEEIAGQLSRSFIKDPKVALEILTYRPFYIFGEVTHPGSYPYASNLTALAAIATAGGYTARADEDFVVIERKIGGKSIKGMARSDTPVRPDDIVRIPERYF